MNLEHKDIVIIGAGIAGLSLAYQLATQSKFNKISLIEKQSLDCLLKSLHPQVLLEPAFVVGDESHQKLNRQAYFSSLDFYQNLGKDVWFAKGLIKLANAEHLAKKEKKLIDLIQTQKPISSQFQYLNADQLSELAHISINQSGIYYPNAGSLNPALITQKIIEKTSQNNYKIDYQFNQSISRIEKKNDEWLLFNSNNHSFLKTKKLIYCAGYQGLNLINSINPSFCEKLSATRGQISIIQSKKSTIQPKMAMSGDGFISPVLKPNTYFNNHHICFGSSWDRDFTESNAISIKDHQSNLTKAENLISQNIMNDEIHHNGLLEQLKASVSVRVNSKNRLPIAREIEENFWLLTALGSRGYQYAPYLSDLLVKKLSFKK